MKLHILSDLHLEFSMFSPPETEAEVVVLAGDIGVGGSWPAWARNAFPGKEIIYVPGNHEFYDGQRARVLTELRTSAKVNGIHLLDNDAVVIRGGDGGNVRFLGCTLWTDFQYFGEAFKAVVMREGQISLTDFRTIHEGENAFTPARSIELHDKSLAWLKAELAKPFDGKTVVVTHHLPSEHSVADRYKSSPLTACFASHLDNMFGKMVLWVHGHTHDCMDYEVSGTRVLCNPRGYVTSHSTENWSFNPRLVVEV